MEGVLEDHNSGPSGRGAGDLDGVLDCLGSRVDEDAPLVPALARRELGEQTARFDIGLVRPDHEALMEVVVELLADGRDDGRVRMAQVCAAEATREVDIGPAVDVLDPRSFSARDDEPRRRDARNDEPRPRFENSLRGRLLLQRHGPTDYPGSTAWISIKSRERASSRKSRDLQ